MNRPQQALPCWQVTIGFADHSTYRCKVFAATSERALALGLQDARMGSVWGQFTAIVSSQKAELLEPQTT